jgi:mono/diheme cytochrome c family protein
MPDKYVTALARLLVLAEFVATQSAIAADAEIGKRIAESRCARCHFVVARRLTPAVAPPFSMIAITYGFNAHLISAAILGPHQRMDEIVTQEEADDVAAYIATIGK